VRRSLRELKHVVDHFRSARTVLIVLSAQEFDENNPVIFVTPVRWTEGVRPGGDMGVLLIG
jgi:hypothetical protein